jgi:hypothetical protein
MTAIHFPRLRAVALALAFGTGMLVHAQVTIHPHDLLALPGFQPGHTAAPRGGAPYNDECTNAVVTPLPYLGTVSITGDNTGGTDTEDFGNPNVWEAFSIDTCSTVTVEYCGTDPVFSIVYSILIIGCPGLESVQNSGDTLCADGNARIHYANLESGTYYLPVLLWPGQAEGPYTITLTSTPCDLPPVNDRCVNALPVPVVADCASGTVQGDNSTTAFDTAPSCATSDSGFRDVWYSFDSGDNTEVTITVDPLTMSDPGIEVRTVCGGSVVFCGALENSYVVPVSPNTNYRLRVFSNNDLGAGGSFLLCIRAGSTPACDGGAVVSSAVEDPIVLCTVDAPVVFTLEGEGTATERLVLTTDADTIVAVLVGGVVDPSLLLPGTYRVHGLSFDGDAVGLEPGAALTDVTATGACILWSDTFRTVVVEVCQALLDGTVDLAAFRAVVDGDDVLLHWLAPDADVQVEVLGVRGELVGVHRWRAVRGAAERYHLPMTAAGPLLIRATWGGGRAHARVMPLR